VIPGITSAIGGLAALLAIAMTLVAIFVPNIRRLD